MFKKKKKNLVIFNLFVNSISFKKIETILYSMMANSKAQKSQVNSTVASNVAKCHLDMVNVQY